MKNYAKIGGCQGRPAYRTPSAFQSQKQKQINRLKAGQKKSRADKSRILEYIRFG